MKLIDSHCHLNMLDLAPYDGNLKSVLQEAEKNNVAGFLSVSVDLNQHDELVSIAEQYNNVYISAGTHPNDRPNELIDLDLFERALQHPKVIAVGETGLDYYRTEEGMKWQQDRFVQHIELAKKYRKPLIVHTRSAKVDTLDILISHQANEASGVMHCFTEDWATAKKSLDLGFYISFSGIVTFKNAIELQEVAKKIPLDRMLVETDSPYLAPIPHRGKPNYPGYVFHVAEFLSQLRSESLETIANQTTENFRTLFNVMLEPV